MVDRPAPRPDPAQVASARAWVHRLVDSLDDQRLMRLYDMLIRWALRQPRPRPPRP